jgi:anti-sigma regulatory factor (Ser/Thr protein kinase)
VLDDTSAARAAPHRDAGDEFMRHVVSATDVTGWRAEPSGCGAPAGERAAPHPDPICVRFPARASQLAVVRRLLTSWLEATGTAPDDIAPIVLAVGEAASNAIEHAYGPSDGWFELGASLAPAEAGSPGPLLTVTVRDGGRWRSKPPGAGVRGIGLMARLMDEFETRRSERGTEVWMRRTLVGKEHPR